MDIQSYMHGVGRAARAASRAMAKADTAAKNRALARMAAAIERDSAAPARSQSRAIWMPRARRDWRRRWSTG